MSFGLSLTVSGVFIGLLWQSRPEGWGPLPQNQPWDLKSLSEICRRPCNTRERQPEAGES